MRLQILPLLTTILVYADQDDFSEDALYNFMNENEIAKQFLSGERNLQGFRHGNKCPIFNSSIERTGYGKDFKNCDFPDLDNSTDWQEVFTDCHGNPITAMVNGTVTKWYKPTQNFKHKSNSSYYFGMEFPNKPGTWENCRALSMDGVGLACPTSDAEAYYLWFYHPAQPLYYTFDHSLGIISGHFRLEKNGNDHACAYMDPNLVAGGTESVGSMYIPYWSLDDKWVFEWDTGRGSPGYTNGGRATNDLHMRVESTLWNDARWDQKNREFFYICEMNCDLLDDPLEGEDDTHTDLDVPSDPDNSGHFIEANEDCLGNPLPVGQTWYKPVINFYGKNESSYLFIDQFGTKLDAYKYCHSLNMPNVNMWCPMSHDESDYIFYHHTSQPFTTTNPSIDGLWNGIFRMTDMQNDYYCGYDADKQQDPLTINVDDLHNPAYKHNVWFFGPWDTDTDQPDYSDLVGPTNEILQMAHNGRWNDAHADSEMGWYVCEMNCAIEENVEENLPIDIPAHPDDEPISELLNQYPDDITPEEIEELTLHGCHCVKLGVLNHFGPSLGGLGKVDSLDGECKIWRDGRRCITLPGGICHEEILDDRYYQIIKDESGQFTCDLNVDPCLNAICLIDMEFASKIFEAISIIKGNNGTFTGTPGDSNVCEFCELCVPALSCEGEAPNVRLVK